VAADVLAAEPSAAWVAGFRHHHSMKRVLPNLLVFFSLALCVLSAFQWVREAHLREDITKLNDKLYQKSAEIQNLEGLLRTTQSEITRLDALKTGLTETLKTNGQELASLKRELEKNGGQIERHLKQIDVYKEAVQTANASIQKQNEDIRKQNDEMKRLADDRNETVIKYNKLVEQYDALAKQFSKYQEDVAKAPR
jgi:chromosome segregation ATPase